MNNQIEAIQTFLKTNASKATISMRAIKDRVNEVLQTNLSQQQIQDHITNLKYEISKSSVVNPFHQTNNKQTQRQSSKTKTQVIQQSNQSISDHEKKNAFSSALLMIDQIQTEQPEQVQEVQEELKEEFKEEVKEEPVINVQQHQLMMDLYNQLYGEQSEEYLTKDIQTVQSGIGKDSRIHRIRVLISDPELINPEIKSNNVYSLLHSSIQMIKMFQTPHERFRQVQETYINKLLSYVNPQLNPQVKGVLDILKSL